MLELKFAIYHRAARFPQLQRKP